MAIPIEKRVDLLKQWFYRKNDRPLLGFYLDSQYPLHRYVGSKKNIKNGKISAENIIVEDYFEDCDRLFEFYEKAGGDLIWSAAPFFGVPWIEASLGCEIIADHAAGSIRSEPPPGRDICIPCFNENNPWIVKLGEFIDGLNEHSKGRYPVGVTLMRGISDLLSALYGSEEFLYKMYDDPYEVGILSEKITDYWISFGKYIMDRIRLFHGGTGSFFYSVWCPGKTIWMQEDAAALLSPDMYLKYIYPANMKIIDTFENTVMHLHPSRFMPVDYLVESNIDVIEIHIDKSGPGAKDLRNQHMKVLDRKPLVIWGDLTLNDLEFIFENLPYKGLAINMVVNSPEEAHSIWNTFLKGRNV